MSEAFAHIPVLLDETMQVLRPAASETFIDATLGGSGHAGRLLELTAPNGRLLGIDADPAALAAAENQLGPYGDRVVLVEAFFDRLLEIARNTDFVPVDGVLFDLGVSSPQLDMAARGFSFQTEAPLDMRLGPSAGHTAADLVQTLPQAELQRIFQEYGEERYSGRIARQIVAQRQSRPIRSTIELAELVRKSVPTQTHTRIHPATRVFQALRIAVNDELGRLGAALPQAVESMREGGRLAVISFHSLEDRIVKRFMRQEARGCVCPPEIPECTCGHEASLRVLTTRPIVAGPAEVRENPRARSAKLRAAQKIRPMTSVRLGGARC
ncbi:MAG: 16S rRNA (cytosine(1402)-N(4))-methyltransferase RsmH [Chloroflexota bacterium]